MASTKELRALITLAGKVDPSLQSAMMKATKMNLNMVQQSQKATSSMNKVWTIAKGVFAGSLMTKGLSLAASGISSVTTKGIELASNLTEVQNVVDTTFGQGSKQIDEWSSKALNAFGLSELQAKKFTGTMGAMLKSSGISSQYLVKMSEGLTGLAGDFASFYNLDQEDAFDKIRSGISGETEPLKQLGINMSVANLQAFAMSKGIKTSYDKMDQASQTLLRYNYLMEQSKDAQGDFNKTLDTSYANQKRLLSTNWAQFTAKAMSGLLPTITKGTAALNNFISKLDGSKVGGAIGKIFNGIITPISSAFPKVMNMVSQFGPAIGDIFSQLSKSSILPTILESVNQLLPAILPAIQQIMPLITQGFKLFASVLGQLIPVLMPVIKSLLPMLSPLLEAVFAIVQPLLPVLVNIISVIGPILTQVLNSILPLIQSIVPVVNFLAKVIAFSLANSMQYITPIIQYAADKIKFLMDICTQIIEFITNVFSGKWQDAWGNINKIFSLAWQNLINEFKGILNTGAGFINSWLGSFNGITKAVGDKLGFNIQIPLISTFADGGFANKPSIFGEAGPEAAIPLKYRNPRSIAILNQTAKAIGAYPSAGGSAQPMQFNFNFYGSVSNREDVISGVKDAEEYILDLWEKHFGGRPSFG